MKKTTLALLLAVLAFTLTACSYKKPERYTVRDLGVDSITTVCGTDCSLSDINVATAGNNCSASYRYTRVEDGLGIQDAKKYHDYLSNESVCAKIEDFSESAGSYTAYIGNPEAIASKDTTDEHGVKKVALGVCIKVSFEADSYTVTITDNINLDEILTS